MGVLDRWMDERTDKTFIAELLDLQKCYNIVNELLNQVITTFQSVVI
jgi:hypothetical protein